MCLWRLLHPDNFFLMCHQPMLSGWTKIEPMKTVQGPVWHSRSFYLFKYLQMKHIAILVRFFVAGNYASEIQTELDLQYEKSWNAIFWFSSKNIAEILYLIGSFGRKKAETLYLIQNLSVGKKSFLLVSQKHWGLELCCSIWASTFQKMIQIF